MIEEVLRVEHVTKKVDGILRLDNLNFTIHQGEIMGMLPLNSHGKKELISVLTQNSTIDMGRVYIDGTLVNYYEHSNKGINKVEIIDVNTRLVEDLTVADNIFVLSRSFGQKIIRDKKLNQDTEKLLKVVGIQIKTDELVFMLDNFERSVIELIKSVRSYTSLIILNEIDNYLSTAELQKFHTLMTYFAKEEGKSFLYLANHHEEVFKVCQRVALFEDGRVVKILDEEHLKDEHILPYIISFNHPYGKKDQAMKTLGREEEREGKVDDKEARRNISLGGDPAILDQVGNSLTMEQGRGMEFIKNRSRHKAMRKGIGDEDKMFRNLLEFYQVSSGTLKHLSFQVKRGECVTLLDIDNLSLVEIISLVSGKTRPDHGQVLFRGQPLVYGLGQDVIDQGMAFIEENPKETMIFKDMSYFENLTFLLDRKLKRSVIPKRILKNIKEEYQDYLGEDMEKDMGQVGSRSIYSLAYYRIHLLNPDLVFLIQPFSNADMYLRAHIITLIHILRKRGITVVILAVSIQDSLSVSDRLITMEKGSLDREYTKEDFPLFRR